MTGGARIDSWIPGSQDRARGLNFDATLPEYRDWVYGSTEYYLDIGMSTAKRPRGMAVGSGAEKPVTAGQLINALAEAIARLSLGSSSGGDGDAAAAVVESLVGVIAGLSKLARETSSAVYQSTVREQEAQSMLAKFKKIAKQQKELIDLHEAQRREEAEMRLAPSPPPIPTMDTGTSTDLSGALLAQQLEDGIRLRATLVQLDEKEALCAQLEEKLLGRVVENRRLKIVVKHAQEVIESQKVLLDEMREARKRRDFLSKSRTPSRENTPTTQMRRAEKLENSEPPSSAFTPSTISFPYVGEDPFKEEEEANHEKEDDEEDEDEDEEEEEGEWEEVEERSHREYSEDESEREIHWQQNGTETISIDSSFDLIQEFYQK